MRNSIQQRAAALGWDALARRMDEDGFARLPALLTPETCAGLRELFDQDRLFRSRIDMARYRFGEGEYKYFDYPLPEAVQELREALYPRLAEIANRWAALLGDAARFPPDLGAFLERCHRAGQRRATPLMLRYEAGGYNTMHQDVYGELTFPLQAVFGLSRPGEDYTGGELILLEQRPRAQSRATALVMQQGEGVVFTTRHKPVAGARGHYRATLRHGVSRVESGQRVTLGVIFHDAS
jgi:uncharacterized protein